EPVPRRREWHAIVIRESRRLGKKIEERAIGRLAEEARQYGVTVGARLVFRRQGTGHGDRVSPHAIAQSLRMSTGFSACMRWTTRQSAHIRSRSSAPASANIE